MIRTLRGLTWIELKLFLREPATVVFTLALPLIMLYILNGVFGNTPDPSGEVYAGYGPSDWYTPSYVGLVLTAVGVLSLPTHLATYRETGVLRRFQASGLPWSALAGGHLVVTLLIGTVGAVSLTVMSVGAYGARLPESWPLSVAAFLLASLVFASLGFLLGALLPTARAAQGAGILLFFVMMLLAGSGPPPEVLPAAMVDLGRALPLTYASDLLRSTWLDGAWDTGASLVLLAVLAAASLLAGAAFARTRHR